VWQELPLPFTIESDRSLGPAIISDHDGHRFPDARFFPMFRAIDALEGTSGVAPVHWPAIDFITDRGNLRRLMRWATPTNKKQSWRIELQLAGKKSVLLSGWNDRTTMFTQPNFYGFSFERHTTRFVPGCEAGKPAHIRSVKYVRSISGYDSKCR
jgi:hypothetical protein